MYKLPVILIILLSNSALGLNISLCYFFPWGLSVAEKSLQVFYVLHDVEYKDIYARTMQVYVVHWMMWIKNQEITVFKNILFHS
jgi:hypothetical protein